MRKRGEFGKTVFCRVMTKAQQAWMPRTALGSRGEKEMLESPTVPNEMSYRMEAEAELPRRVYGVNGVVGVASRGFLPKGGGGLVKRARCGWHSPAAGGRGATAEVKVFTGQQETLCDQSERTSGRRAGDRRRGHFVCRSCAERT